MPVDVRMERTGCAKSPLWAYADADGVETVVRAQVARITAPAAELGRKAEQVQREYRILDEERASGCRRVDEREPTVVGTGNRVFESQIQSVFQLDDNISFACGQVRRTQRTDWSSFRRQVWITRYQDLGLAADPRLDICEQRIKRGWERIAQRCVGKDGFSAACRERPREGALHERAETNVVAANREGHDVAVGAECRDLRRFAVLASGQDVFDLGTATGNELERGVEL